MSESLAERADNRSAAYATITVGKDSSVRMNGRLRRTDTYGWESIVWCCLPMTHLVNLPRPEFEVSPPRPTLSGVRNKTAR